MRGAAAGLMAMATVAIACAETPVPTAGTTSGLTRNTYTEPAATATACLTVPASAHPGCYHPGSPPQPDARLTTTEDDARLSKDEIQGVVTQHLMPIKCCYESQLKGTPDLAGSVVLGWTIEPTGIVSRVWIVDRMLGSDATVDCIGEEICGWQFPAVDAPTTVDRYPFAFRR
jgi:hypothetical protein